jgi:hypothetical protein
MVLERVYGPCGSRRLDAWGRLTPLVPLTSAFAAWSTGQADQLVGLVRLSWAAHVAEDPSAIVVADKMRRQAGDCLRLAEAHYQRALDCSLRRTKRWN